MSERYFDLLLWQEHVHTERQTGFRRRSGGHYMTDQAGREWFYRYAE